MTAELGERLLGSGLEERIDPRARSRMEVRRLHDLVYLEAELPGVFRTFFTTRRGGVSQGEFAALNLDPRSSDDPRAVEHNRSLVMRVLEQGGTLARAEGPALGSADRSGADPVRADSAHTGCGGTGPEDAGARYRFVSPAQAHGVRVLGAREYVGGHLGTPCDGLTLSPNLDEGLAALLVFADCVPVVLASEVDMAVVHGGWRGILGGVVQQAGRSMTGPPGTAVIGPSIGPCCYTVGEEVARGFGARFGTEVVTGLGDVAGGPQEGVYRVDLWAAVTKAVVEMGVGEDQIVNPRLCTACNTDFFYSYRREGPVTGRHGCIAWAVAA